MQTRENLQSFRNTNAVKTTLSKPEEVLDSPVTVRRPRTPAMKRTVSRSARRVRSRVIRLCPQKAYVKLRIFEEGG